MGVDPFTSQYTDRSNSTGHQFEFYCDLCRKQFMSSFQTSKTGLAGGFLRAAGSLLGGKLHQVASAGDQIQHALQGSARDAAFNQAVAEGKRHFKQCPRCAKWVCPDRCWSAATNTCKACESAGGSSASPASAAVSACPACGARAKEGTSPKFCPECGKPMPVARTACSGCGASLTPGAKFCGECGAKQG